MSFTVEGRVAFSSFLLEPLVSRKPYMQAMLHAFLWSTGNGGGGDAAGSLLLFPVLSELLSPLRWWAGAAGLQTLQLFVSVPGTTQQQSEIAAPSLPPQQPVKGGRGMSYSDRFNRWQGKNNSYFHQCPPVSMRVPCPPADLQQAQLALPCLPSPSYR